MTLNPNYELPSSAEADFDDEYAHYLDQKAQRRDVVWKGSEEE